MNLIYYGIVFNNATMATESESQINFVLIPDTNECPICINNFTKKVKSKVICSKCNYSCCKQCYQQYLLSTTNDPACMNCKTPWNMEFLYENLTRSFINGEYRKHKTNLMIEIEKSKIPETMPKVEKYNKEKKIQEQIRILRKEISDLEEQRRIKLHKKYQLEIQFANSINGVISSTGEKKQFMHKCGNGECKGFLSSQWNCAVCEGKTCSKCFVYIGKENHDSHECKEDDVKTAEFIKKDTKPCPQCATPIHKIIGCDQMWCTQCHVAFSWKNGTISHTNNIHNPHYFQFLRNGGQNVRTPGDQHCGGININGFYTASRNMVSYLNNYFDYNFKRDEVTGKVVESKIDVIKRCNINYKKISNLLSENNYFKVNNLCFQVTNAKKCLHISMIDNTEHMIRGARHTLDYLQSIRRYMTQAENTFDLARIQFIVKEIDEKRFQRIITKELNTKSKGQRTLQVLEVFNAVVTETINSIINKYSECIKNQSRKTNTEEFVITEKENEKREKHIVRFFEELSKDFNNLMKIRNYCNSELEKIGKQYNNKPLIINKECQVNKYNW